MDAILKALGNAGALLESLLTLPHVVAVLFGLAAGMGAAQLLKPLVAIAMFDEGRQCTDESERVRLFRWLVRAIGVVACTVTCALLWPNGYPWLAGFAVSAGVSPGYHLLAYLASKRFPGISATRRAPPAGPDDRPPDVRAAEDHDGLDTGGGP